MTDASKASDLMETVHQTLFPTRLQETRPSPGKKHEQAALHALEAVMRAACQGCNSSEIQQRLNDLISSMLPLDDEAIAAVDKANGRVLPHVSDFVAPAIRAALDHLDANFHLALVSAKDTLRPIRDQVKEIIVAMADERGVESAGLASAIPVVLQVRSPAA